jgi:hypothetical protein
MTCLATCGVVAKADAQTAPATVRVNVETTALRDRPSIDGAMVATVKKDDELTVLGREGDWYRVRTKTPLTEGYVNSEFVEVVVLSTNTYPPKPPPGHDPKPPDDPKRESAQAVSGGLEFGANISSFSYPLYGVTSSREHGVVAGGFATFPVAGPLSAQVEIVYEQKPWQVVDRVGGFGYNTYRYHVGVLEVPVLARLDVGQAFVLGGVAFGGIRSLTREADGATATSEDVKNLFVGSDLTLVAGAGLRVARLEIEGRYDAGLHDLTKNPNAGDPPFKSRTISVLARIRF